MGITKIIIWSTRSLFLMVNEKMRSRDLQFVGVFCGLVVFFFNFSAKFMRMLIKKTFVDTANAVKKTTVNSSNC